MTVANDSEFQQRMRQVEGLVDQIETHPDPSARELSRRLTQALLDLHEVGFRRMLELLSDGSDTVTVPSEWQNDPLVSNLLILHQLHPLSVQTRIAKALADLQPLLEEHQVQLEITELTDQQVQLQMSGGCGGCGSSQQTIRREVDAAICASAPELQVTITGPEPAMTNSDSMLPILNQGSVGR
jgi:Fe-S cluster biogenesis protein NfuA